MLELELPVSVGGRAQLFETAPERFVEESLQRWERFVRNVLSGDAAYVVEGYPYQSTSRVLLGMDAGEALIREQLSSRIPGSSMLGEEHGSHDGTTEVGWIVDPVDGTVNFLYDLPIVSVSIAATVNGEIVAGAVVDVLREETYSASLGGGARRDGERIDVNQPPTLAQALLATGFSYDAAIRQQQGTVVQRVVGEARDVRGFGSSALHLCFVACGRVDGYWETDLKPWDVAAGGLIAAEAGAVVRTPATTGGTLTLAAPPSIAGTLLALVDPAATDGR